ncbi:chymotrypsin-2-like isoform X2 [Coccinella septempunctata]|nr:chymotrypsin-2-like isoform X2 [Coccinella septempunctata]
MRSNHICGGTILTKSFILTAAHCVVHVHPIDLTWNVQDPLEFNIVAGQTVLDLGECQFHDVKKIYVHSGYNHTRMSNDIALLEIFGLLEWTKYTQVAEIFSKVHSPFESHDFCTAIGWGSTEVPEKGHSSAIQGKNTLQQVDLHPSLHSTCESFFSPAPHLFDSTKLCVITNEDKDTCVGDSGGPLICNGVQYGITSFGLGCAQLNMPGVFTNISAFHDWIYGVLNSTETLVVSRMVETVNLTRNLLIEEHNRSGRSKNSQPSFKYFLSFQYIFILLSIKFLEICIEYRRHFMDFENTFNL